MKFSLVKQLWACFVLLGAAQALAQTPQSLELMQHYDLNQIDSIINSSGIPASIIDRDFEVDVYKLIYNTTDAQGQPTIASGAICVPTGSACALPLSSYQHGTIFHKELVPSRLSLESVIGILYATGGYVVNMPDYLGLGDSPGLHPYVHADTEASAVLDMLRSTRILEDSLGVRLNDQLFLFGYSQGGHATMAAHRSAQEDFPNEFSITASAPMSGPYDISGIQRDIITMNTPYDAPSYLPYVALAYQSVYGNLWDSIPQILVPPYDTLIPPLFNGQFTSLQIEAVLPSIPNQIIDSTYLAQVQNDPNHPMNVALRDNDLYDWVPEDSLRMLYCEADELVSYMNTILTNDTMLALGATTVEILSAGATLGHGDCAPFALLSGKAWFDTMRDVDNGIEISSTVTDASNANASDGSISIQVTGGIGPFTLQWNTGSNDTLLDNLTPATYILTVTDSFGCDRTFLIPVGTAVGISEASLNALNVYPNPARDQLTFAMKRSNTALESIRLYSIDGTLVQDIQSTQVGSTKVSINHLAPGIYHFVAVTSEGQQFGRFVKE